MKKTRKMASDLSLNNFQRESDFLLYTTPDGKVRLEIFIKNENIWLTQERISQLFGVDRSVVTKHLKNIYESGELVEGATSSNRRVSSSNSITGFLQPRRHYFYGLPS